MIDYIILRNTKKIYRYYEMISVDNLNLFVQLNKTGDIYKRRVKNACFYERGFYKNPRKVFTIRQECVIIFVRRKLNNATPSRETWNQRTFFLLVKMYAPFLYAFPCLW